MTEITIGSAAPSSSEQSLGAPDPWQDLRRHTPARIALGRTGVSLPTAEVLRFSAAHAQARDAVHVPLNTSQLLDDLGRLGFFAHPVHSRAATRLDYLRRPDWGRRLDATSAQHLEGLGSPACDLAVVIGDGLSSAAAQQHAAPMLLALRRELDSQFRWAPVVVAVQARVALADEIGALLNASAVLIVLGERPGLSAPDSLGAYLTFAPHVGKTDAQRNCVSNIRPDGLAPAVAAFRLAWLIRESLRRRISGVALKDDSVTPLLTG